MSDLESFRSEAKDWITANLPPSLKRRGARAITDEGDSSICGAAAARNGPIRMRSSGSSAWATRAGARRPGRRNTAAAGSRAAEARVLEQEIGRAGAAARRCCRSASGCSARRCSNTAPRSRSRSILPKIVRGEIRWCQGYSEPGAGSDLASLQTQCEDKGDHWLINGSEDLDRRTPNYADWMLLPGAHRHHEEARGHQLPADRHDDAGRRDAADQADQRHLAVLRDLLHRREGAEGATWSAR